MVYNYYGGGNPTSCSPLPTAGTGNNGNVRGYYYLDSTNSSQNHTASFTIDALNRLTFSGATGSQAHHHLDFSYDRYGNMTCVTDSQTDPYSACQVLTFDAGNHLTTINTNVPVGHDAAGNMQNEVVHNFQWDAESWLKSVDNGSTWRGTFNALGQRVEQAPLNLSWRQELLYDAAGQELGTFDGNGGVWWDRCVNFGGRVLADVRPDQTVFLHANTLGSTSQATGTAKARPAATHKRPR